MDILYDISVLGNGYSHLRSRTGIFRATEHVVLGLAQSGQCHLDFCATSSLTSLNDAQDYLANHPQLKNCQLMGAGFPKHLHRFFWQKVLKANQSANLTLQQRLLRKASYQITQFIERLTVLLDSDDLTRYRIFHSAFYPFPEVVKQAKKLSRFLTVYDLIPILFPQYFEKVKQPTIDLALANLSPEDWVLCISQATRHDLCNHLSFLDPDRVQVTYLAASENFYPCDDRELMGSIRQKYRIPNDVPYLLSLGTLEPRKNIDHVVRCFTNLVQQEKLSDLHLVLVGTQGWDCGQIFTAIAAAEAQHHLKNRVITTGFVEDQDLAPIYSGALAFIYPSFYEGFGLPPLEAMQCGIPVITSNTSSLPEVVGEAGIMLDPQDADGLCQAILSLYHDGNLRYSLAEKSRQRAQLFSWQRCVQQTLAAYQSA